MTLLYQTSPNPSRSSAALSHSVTLCSSGGQSSAVQRASDDAQGMEAVQVMACLIRKRIEPAGMISRAPTILRTTPTANPPMNGENPRSR